ncbi:MAG: hypothetical protein U0002_19000 [Thermoanaerobaculia bacterium]
MRATCLWLTALALVAAVPAFAADSVIQSGVDLWTTSSDGSTFVDFSKTPIPAGFFCPGSAPFTSLVAFGGVPLVSNKQGFLGDTVVQRLDDAVFDASGVATTRLQVRALSLRSLAALRTECGSYSISAKLEGVQPITRMTIVRENEAGGTYSAPLQLNVALTFRRLGTQVQPPLQLALPVRFGPAEGARWTRRQETDRPSLILLDTNNDRLTDTYFKMTPNFLPGGSGPGAVLRSCHTDPATGEEHCVDPEPTCGRYAC